MKIIFILPSVGRKEDEDYIKTWQMEPLSIAQIAGLTPEYIDIQFFDDRLEEINYGEPADLVAISAETYTAKRAYQISNNYRRKGVKVILGGFHPTLMPEEAIQHADSVVIGEAEEVWQQVLEDAKKDNLKRFYKSERRPALNGVRPNREIFKGKQYLPISLIESARGCNFSCNFCSISSFYNSSYRCRPISEVISEIKELKRKNIFLIDDNIGADNNRAKGLFEALIPLNIRWVSQISINALRDDRLLDLMVKSGCIGVLIGLESLNDKNLEQMNKSWNKKIIDYEESLERLKEKGIAVYATFLFGYDWDDLDSFNKTLEFAIRHKFFLVAFNHLVPFPGTPLYEMFYKEGRLLYDKWWIDPNYYFGDIAFQPRNISSEQLREICINFRKRFYGFHSILRRAMDFKTNCKNLFMSFTFFSLNLLFRKEIMQRVGLPIGER